MDVALFSQDLDLRTPQASGLEASSQPAAGQEPLSAQPSIFQKTSASAGVQPPSALDFETLIIEDVRLTGYRNIKESLIRSQIKTRKGEVFDGIQAKSDIKRLMSLGPFASADVTVSTVAVENRAYLRVIFDLVEKPKIKKIHIQGAKKVSKGTVKEALAPSQEPGHEDMQKSEFPEFKNKDWRVEMSEGSFFDEFRLAEGIARIKAKYQEKSVWETSVEVEKKLDEEANRIELTLKINEGRKVRVAKIDLSGFENYPEKKVKKAIKIRENKHLDSKKAVKGLEKLNSLYKESGWLDFKVSMSTRVLTEDEFNAWRNRNRRNLDDLPLGVVYQAEEGRRHFLLNYRFAGNDNISDKDLRKLANLPVDKVLKESRLKEAEAAILNKYHENGRLFAGLAIEKIWRDEPDGVELLFQIDERQLVYVANVYIEGLNKTKEYVIRREVLFKEGDLFSSKRLNRSVEKIINLGFIDDVRPDYDPTPNPDYVDLVFDVKEGRPGMLTAGAGFSSIDGMVGTISLSHMNILGRAQRINLSTEFGKRRQSYDITWTTPWTMGRRMSTSLSLFNTNRSLQFASETTGFKRRSKGGSIFFGPRFKDDIWTVGIGYSLQRDKIYDVLDVFRAQIPETTTTRSAVTLRLGYDTRDFKWDPKRGMSHVASVEFAGGPVGGNVHFVKPTFSHSASVPTLTLGRHLFVLYGGLRWGFLQEYSRFKPVPVSDKFYVGGAETVRGYTYTGQIGPIEGGNVFGVANLEYKIPLVMEGRFTIIQFALFSDIGGAWRGAQDINLNFGRGLNKVKAGVGFGIRLKTPAFPVRLDWGWGLHHRPGEAISQFYFTIGDIGQAGI